jgi:hypothetical protein
MGTPGIPDIEIQFPDNILRKGDDDVSSVVIT